MEIQGSSPLGVGHYGNPVAVDRSAESRAARAAAGGPAPEAPRGDTVSVSQDALLLTEALRAAQDAPDVRTEKVEALRIQVANGTYTPDSRLIAENLVREEPWLFQI